MKEEQKMSDSNNVDTGMPEIESKIGMLLEDIVGAVRKLVHAGEPDPKRETAVMAGLESIGLTVSNGAGNFATALQVAFHTARDGGMAADQKPPAGPRRTALLQPGMQRG